ncbi:S1/P1 nuclease [Microthyrium microscopicum]|uniref:S1/P1 nuclease n=1 Tax=Microthyrium microscopicum TaxID=703497 RepID=A0A6A6TUY9_9PEZI|nr:S1/P1 nuclease [Microthyrium microscopicum]
MRISSVAFGVSCLLSQAFAWGEVGHRTVAYVAYRYLSLNTQVYVDNILNYHDGRDIGDAAIWPDQIKYGRPYTAPWHYIDARDSPPTLCGLNYPADCGDKESDGCIITALHNYTTLFMDPKTHPLTRQEALKYVIHFIGDIHQPLHTEDAFRGGNEIPVCFRKACSHHNLHSVWDRDIVHKLVGIPTAATHEQETKAAKDWADRLVGVDANLSLLKAECDDVVDPDQCSLAWARESNAWICKYVMKPGLEWLSSNDLSLEYFDGAVPIVEYQVKMGGIRLAAWLEAMIARAQSMQSARKGTQHVLREMEF